MKKFIYHQTKTEGIIFYQLNGKQNFLLLKRVKKDGGFWQPVTGTKSDDETLGKCLLREIEEETGITKKQIIKIINNVLEFEWDKKGKKIKEYVYGIEVKPNTDITINPQEHTKFVWLKFNKAINMLTMEKNKIALKNLLERINT
ncbi:MAG: NUDIX domain-containing protein [Patescibacteria group bacterium]